MGLDGKSWLVKCLLLRWFELGLGSGVSFGFRGVLGFEVGNGDRFDDDSSDPLLPKRRLFSPTRI